MADYTNPTIPWAGADILSSGMGLLGNYMSGQKNNQIYNQLNSGLAQANNFVDTAYNQGAIPMQTYLNTGEWAMPYLREATRQINSPYTLQQYQASPYSQIADINTNDMIAQLQAGNLAKGAYGSGNMANDLVQNANKIKMNMYDQAAQREYARQGQAFGADFNLAEMGNRTAQSLAANAMNAAKYKGDNAALMGQNSAQATGNQNALNMGAMQGLTGLLNTGIGAALNSDWLRNLFTSDPGSVSGFDPTWLSGNAPVFGGNWIDPGSSLYNPGGFDPSWLSGGGPSWGDSSIFGLSFGG